MSPTLLSLDSRIAAGPLDTVLFFDVGVPITQATGAVDEFYALQGQNAYNPLITEEVYSTDRNSSQRKLVQCPLHLNK